MHRVIKTRQVARRRKMQMRPMMIGKESGFSPVGSGLRGTSSAVALRNASTLAVGEVSLAAGIVLIFPTRHSNKSGVRELESLANCERRISCLVCVKPSRITTKTPNPNYK